MREPGQFALISLGCAKNLVDSEEMLSLLCSNGYVLSQEMSDLDFVIINTCGFIESAKEEAIEQILEAAALKARGEVSKIIVTGCLTERYKDEVFAEIPEVDAIVGCGRHLEILDVVNSVFTSARVSNFGDINYPVKGEKRLITTPFYTAYVKIAEGCDNRCAYCVIPGLRGKFRSREITDILDEVKTLVDNGVREIILVAQDTTRYGADLYGQPSLIKLLNSLCDHTGVSWIRLHYLYPDEVTDELIDVIKHRDQIVKYIDMPLQHINSRILRLMNRRYDKEQTESLIKKLRREIKDVVIRTSVIVGLPTESDAEFTELCEFLKDYKPERCGIFKYSPEEGTPAANMSPQVDGLTKDRRYETASGICDRNLDTCAKSLIGRRETVLCEGRDAGTGMYYGRRYADSPDIDLLTHFSGNDLKTGDFYEVLFEDAEDCELYGIAEPLEK